MSSASVSVLITLEREREVARRSIASWSAGAQTHDGPIELVALCDAKRAPAPVELGAPGIEVLHLAGASRTELFDLAARRSASDLLLLTEAHCIAAPDCVEQLLATLAAEGAVGACARTEGVAAGPFARLDQRLFEEGFAINSRPGDWRKVWPHGFVIDRRAYLDSGGFDHRFDVFGEQLFSARLHRRGDALAYAEGAVVAHHYGTELGEVRSHVGNCTRGRQLWESEGASEDGLEAHLWPPPGGRGDTDRAHATAIALALAREAWERRLGWGRRAGIGVARRQLRWLGPALLGRPGEVAIERARLEAAVARCHLWRRSERRLEPAYRDLWARTVEHGRARHRRPARRPITDTGRRPIATIPSGALGGLREPLEREGETYRWSGPGFSFDTALAPGEYEIEIETGGLRPRSELGGLAVYQGARRLAAERIESGDRGVRFRPESDRLGREQRWVVTCEPTALTQERTGYQLEVGLPVFAIDVRGVA